jgi:hypothetical protein
MTINKDLMLDFETLGNGKDKCLCQVGAVYFNSSTGELGESLKINIDAGSHEKVGGKLDADTVYWWLQQSDAARSSLLPDRKPILEAMTQLNEFISKATRIWSHATFDFVTLMETFKQLGIKPSVSYKAGLDIRTLVYLSGISLSDVPRTGTHHDALADCEHQVKYCVIALNTVKTNKHAIKFLEKLSK